MKNFSFRLERVRQWRGKEFAIAEARLEQLFAEKRLVHDRLRLLEAEAVECTSVLGRKTAIEPSELQAMDSFRRHAAVQRGVIARLFADCDRRIADQRSNVMEARRRCDLLDKLKEQQWKLWNAQLERETEAQAGELFLAKWSTCE